jgi:AraC-like DNA-binding protein
MAALFQPFPMLPARRAQVWRHQPSFRRPRHFHDEPEINLVVAGCCAIGAGDRTLRLSAGEVVVFQPGQDHELIDSSADLELFVLALDPQLTERAVGFRALASCRTAPLAAADPVQAAHTLASLGDVSDRDAVEARLADFFAQSVERARGGHVLSRRALESARREPSLPEAELARRLATAPSRLSRRFHEEIGVTLVEYRARRKLIRFVELADAGHPLSRAALEADFGSYGQCHRVFRRALGCSPLAYFRGKRHDIARALAPT